MTRYQPQLLAAISLASLLLLSACSGEPAPERESPLQPSPPMAPAAVVEVQLLQLQTLRPTVEVVGVVQAAEQVKLSADVAAPVAAVHVKEGQRVSRGQLLLELDSEKLALQLVRAQEALKQAQSRQAESDSGLKRRRQLAEQRTLSQELLDAAEHDWQRSRAAVQEAAAQVSLARRELADCRLSSPVAGVVDKQLVESGETVRPGDELMIVQATDSLEVQTWVGERDINYLELGGEASVLISDWQQHRYRATVLSLGIAANPRSGNFPVTLLLQDRPREDASPAQTIRPGMTARINIRGRGIDDVLLLPEAALVDRRRQRVVYVVEDGIAHRRQPRLQAGLGDQLLVLSGLSAGEQLVVVGAEQLVDGVAVSIKDSDVEVAQ